MKFYISEENDNFYLNILFDKQYKSFVVRSNSLVLLSSGSLKSSKGVSGDDLNIKYLLRKQGIDFSKTFVINVSYFDSYEIHETNFYSIYDSNEFNDKYFYDGPLGAIYNKNETNFYVWSPYASDMKLKLENETFTMNKIKSGVWHIKIEGDLSRKKYNYIVTNSLYDNKEVVDPYASCVADNGSIGVVVDFNALNPIDWDLVKIKEYNPQNMVVYESHISDLTSSDTWNGKNRNTFKGFYEEGTFYEENGIKVSTGFDHIKELGVNAVELMPIFDAYDLGGYNWNYNPRNYNSLNNLFSSDKDDPLNVIKEFKELIKAYNKNNINIIMDVVYNHVYKYEESNFEYLVPGYYFRHFGLNVSDGSGCGNEFASERKMASKFIIDSVLFYAKEYKIAGFRFDLMGLLDINTLNKIKSKLFEISPYIVMFGEPWSGGRSALDPSIAAMQYNIEKYEGYGCFNDKMRDGLIKGGFNNIKSRGYINSLCPTDNDINNILNGMNGYIGYHKDDINKCVNYVSCHDNYTVYDRLKALGESEDIKDMSLLAHSIILTSKGISFIYSGEEFLRTKYGDYNSYMSSYSVNEIDYSLKIKNYDMFKAFNALIKFKINNDIFDNDSEFIISTNYENRLIEKEIYSKDKKALFKIVHNSYGDINLNLEGYKLYFSTKGDKKLSHSTHIKPFETLILYKLDENSINKEREAGVLMHITSLPSKYGIGTLGLDAKHFIDYIKSMGFKLWQILPLGPTGYGDSPYQGISSNALNYYLIDFDILSSKKLLHEEEYKNIKWFYDESKVDYEIIFKEKINVLKLAFERFDCNNNSFKEFVLNEKYKLFAVFMTLKEINSYKSFDEWNILYSNDLVEDVVKKYNKKYLFWLWTQYEFLDEWNEIHKYATSHGIKIIGDIPYYVSYDSVEMWSNKDMFDKRYVGGCPPDQFSSDGQLWGNPCYSWEYMYKDGFRWWNERISDQLELVDILRIDHFRGFDRYYAIPKDAKNAKIGTWLDGPKMDLFFDKLKSPIVAEDLGVIDDGVKNLMSSSGYPGMRVLEFGFDGNDNNINLPHNYPENTISYTGTHDNMTYIQFLNDNKDKISYLNNELLKFGIEKSNDIYELAKKSIEMVLKSNSKIAIIPIQDLYMLDGNSRMNEPSTMSKNNWSFRITKYDESIKDDILKLIKDSNR